MRVREEREKENEQRNEENIFNLRNIIIKGKKFSIFLYPGIYDINMSISDLSEDDLIQIINTILEKRPIFILDNNIIDAEDVVMHITQEIKANTK